MSDQWEFFPCQMGDDVAMIFYDHGIRESINELAPDRRVRFDLTYTAPASNGMPTDQEFEPVKAIEDSIEAFCSGNAGYYVGRVTVAGHRYFYCYSDSKPELIEQYAVLLRESSGYRIEYTLTDDPKKEGYWKDLFPTPDDWRVILDSKVIEALRNNGDPLVESRRIDHWAYFKNRSEASRFAAWAESKQYRIEKVHKRKVFSRETGVQFFRTDLPAPNKISSITVELQRKAEEMGGEYDGWETEVRRAPGHSG